MRVAARCSIRSATSRDRSRETNSDLRIPQLLQRPMWNRRSGASKANCRSRRSGSLELAAVITASAESRIRSAYSPSPAPVSVEPGSTHPRGDGSWSPTPRLWRRVWAYRRGHHSPGRSGPPQSMRRPHRRAQTRGDQRPNVEERASTASHRRELPSSGRVVGGSVARWRSANHQAVWVGW